MDPMVKVALEAPNSLEPINLNRGEDEDSSQELCSQTDGELRLSSSASPRSQSELTTQFTPNTEHGAAPQDCSLSNVATTNCQHALDQHYARELLEAANTLQSVCNVQDTSLDLMENRHRELIEIRETYQLDDVVEEAQSYYNKLLRLKKEMAILTAKSKELVKRSAYVRDVQAKERAKKDEERKKMEQIERDLAPRYASDLTN